MRKKQTTQSSLYALCAIVISSAFTIYIVYNFMTLDEGQKKEEVSQKEENSKNEQKNNSILNSKDIGTVRIFNPKYSKTELENELRAYARIRFPQDPDNLYKAYYEDKVESFIYDINEISLNGWEIKNSRQAWIDLDGDGNPDWFEWGTEFILQK